MRVGSDRQTAADATPAASAATLTVISGPMFAGKTTRLLELVAQAEAAGRAVVVCSPAGDTRSGQGAVATHTGQRRAAVACACAEAVLAAADQAAGTDAGVLVAVDEAHFFGAALVEPVRRLLARRGTAVVVAGLDLDHRGHGFEPFPTLHCLADRVEKLTAPCARCGGAAVYSQRMVADQGRIVVGGAGAYEARCRACFTGGV